MQSPVWLSYDPSYETASIPSDWEYYSDDYWDEESTTKRKRKGGAIEETAAGGDSIERRAERKRKKLKRTEDVPEVSGESTVVAPTVVWKSKNDVLQPFEGPVVSEGQGERVSLLKDWRERFKVPSKQKPSISRPIEVQQKDSQKAIAVVVSSQPAERIHGDTLPPMKLSNSHGLPSRFKAFRSNTNWTSSATNRTTRATKPQDIPPQEIVQGQPSYGASSKSRKGKLPNPSGTPPVVDRALPATYKKRKVASIGGNIEVTASQKLGDSHRPARRTTALSTGKGGSEVSSDLPAEEAAPSSRKRKAESENELVLQSSKRNASFKTPASDIADETWKDTSSPPSRRRNRKRLG